MPARRACLPRSVYYHPLVVVSARVILGEQVRPFSSACKATSRHQRGWQQSCSSWRWPVRPPTIVPGSPEKHRSPVAMRLAAMTRIQHGAVLCERALYFVGSMTFRDVSNTKREEVPAERRCRSIIPAFQTRTNAARARTAVQPTRSRVEVVHGAQKSGGGRESFRVHPPIAAWDADLLRRSGALWSAKLSEPAGSHIHSKAPDLPLVHRPVLLP